MGWLLLESSHVSAGVRVTRKVAIRSRWEWARGWKTHLDKAVRLSRSCRVLLLVVQNTSVCGVSHSMEVWL